MNQRLFLVRHGRTGWNESGRYLSRTEIDLNDTGIEEATQLGWWAASTGIGEIVTSPALRALRTASIVGAQLGLTTRVDERLRELDFGAAEGRTLAELRRDDALAVARFEMDPVTYHLPGGEDPLVAAARVQAAIQDVLALKEARVLVVSHNHVLRLLLCHCLRIPLTDYRRLLPIAEHCAVSELSVDGGQLALRRFNAILWSAEPAFRHRDRAMATNRD
jgi:broad specificity phosphatase PhoE